jgi:hypothetical protein
MAAAGPWKVDEYEDEWDTAPKSGVCCKCEEAKYVTCIGQSGNALAATKWRGRNLCGACRKALSRELSDAKVRIQLIGKAAYKSHYHRILLAHMLTHGGRELFFRAGVCRTTKTSSATEISRIRSFLVSHFATMTTT